MRKFVVDANLPFLFSLWKNERFIHVFDINDDMTDEEIWEYAKINNLTIITKDSDFSTKILLRDPPPKVIHLKIGNLKMKNLYEFLQSNWTEIETTAESHKLVNVFINRIQGIG